MKIFLKSIVLLFLVFFTANAAPLGGIPGQIEKEKANIADPSALDNARISVYLHPVILLFGAGVSNSLILYSTVEIPLSSYNAPIIRPSIWNAGEVLRVGSDFGFRHYLAGKGDGLYLQPQFGVFYFSAKDFSSFNFDINRNDDYRDAKKDKGTWIDGMIYMGRAYKFAYISTYYDAGIGYGCALSICSLMFDANFGLGIAF
jgi:hypothetical protein